ncbi:hypothetical protein T484DRAFT_1777857 [Baffinella frigidus]|nr:hypothetical protein T484DRAFT_1777857 [Cryptophyta sp. CCMP2293]
MSEAETWKPSTIWLAGGAVVLGAMLWWKLSKPDAPRASEMTGQVAVVTGGTSGIGRETCDRLVSKGVFVVLACRDLEAGRKVAAQLQVLSLKVFVVLACRDVWAGRKVAAQLQKGAVAVRL